MGTKIIKIAQRIRVSTRRLVLKRTTNAQTIDKNSTTSKVQRKFTESKTESKVMAVMYTEKRKINERRATRCFFITFGTPFLIYDNLLDSIICLF